MQISHFVHTRQHPAYGAVSTTDEHTEVHELLEDFQTEAWSIAA